MKGRKAAFVDRDGVINGDPAYVHRPVEFNILPGVPPALRLLAARIVCDCRKPMPGLLRRAAVDLGLDLEASFLVGDRLTDIEAGRAAGVGRCYLVGSFEASPGIADATFPDLLDCARTVCQERRP